MILLPQTIVAKLLANGEKLRRHPDLDLRPVVKLFTPDANCTWLLASVDPDDHRIAFGLADLGLGFPELGDIWLPDLHSLRGQLGLPVERDRHFDPNGTLCQYADAAGNAGHVVDRVPGVGDPA